MEDKKLEKKIEKWLSKGLIDEETADKLIAEIKFDKENSKRIKINIVLYTIAAILIGTGVISFIAANDWVLEFFKRFEIMKIVSLFTCSALSLYFGYFLAFEKQSLKGLGNFLIFLSSILIGANYALIGQTYNVNANNSSLMFLWMLSILPVAYCFKNYAVNILSILLFILGVIFFYAELSLDKSLIWTIFIPVLIGLLLYTFGNINFVRNKYVNFALSYKITGLVPIFITLIILTCSVEHSYQLTSPYYFVPVCTALVINLINGMANNKNNLLLKIETVFLTVVSISLLLILSIPQVSIAAVMIFAHISLITIIAAGFNYGYKFENSVLIGLTNKFLIFYLTVMYCRWGWNFFDKTLFFIFGGAILLTAGIMLEKKRKNFIKRKKQ